MCETILKNTNFDLRRVSVLSDFKDLFGMDCFQDYINDAEKKELVSQILGGEFEIDEWQRRGQLINDFVANLGDILDPLDFLFLERDVVKEKFGDASIREWLIRQKLDKINAGSINDEEHEQRNTPAAS